LTVTATPGSGRPLAETDPPTTHSGVEGWVVWARDVAAASPRTHAMTPVRHARVVADWRRVWTFCIRMFLF
jgi:hypothetical protein